VAFIVGEAAQGPTDRPTLLYTIDDFTRVYGARMNALPVIFDSVDAYFRVGGGSLYFQRAADGADPATGSLAGGTVTAGSGGAWGNDLTVELVTVPGGAFVDPFTNGRRKDRHERSVWLTYDEPVPAAGQVMGTVKIGDKMVQVSQPISTAGDLKTWLASGSYATFDASDLTTALEPATVTLAGGADGTVPVSPDALAEAAANIPSDLGPGQLMAPGKSDYEEHAAILGAAAATDRVAILDGDIDWLTNDYLTAAGLLRGAEEDRYGSLWGPWAVIPGLAPGTTRVVPWSPIEAALCARVDAAGNPNQAVAGNWGIPDYVTGLVREFTSGDRETLLLAGVCTAATVYGVVQAYAFRTLSDPAGPRQEWREFNWARLDMAIKARAKARGQTFVFSQLDGRNHTIAAFGGAMTSILIDYFNRDALFGDDPTEAFSVNTGPAVNTVAKLNDGILSAALQVRMSPHAELVQIVMVKIPITVALV
jgi:hypothetical protein